MNLSDDLFEQIVSSLGAGEVTTLPSITLAKPGTQRRAGRRLSVEANTAVRLIPLTDAIAPGPIEVDLRDVSPGGAGFLHTSRISLDEQFVLCLPSQEGEIAILCGVAYWQPLAENRFAIGAKFARVLRQGSAAPPPTVVTAPIRRAV